jgi:hypothetical protein
MRQPVEGSLYPQCDAKLLPHLLQEGCEANSVHAVPQNTVAQLDAGAPS